MEWIERRWERKEWNGLRGDGGERNGMDREEMVG